MAHFAPLLLQLLDLSDNVFALSLSKFLKLFDDAEFLFLVGFFFVANVCSRYLTGFEEMVASGCEALPEVFAILARNGSNLFPLLLQVDEDVACGTPFRAVHQRFGLLHEFLLLGKIAVKFVLEVFEEGVLLLEESVATLAETLEDGCVHLLRSKANRLPFSLQLLNLLRDGIPIGEGLEPFCREGFKLFAECSLLRQVLFLASLKGVEVSLMFLIDDRRGFLELCPNVFADFLGNRTGLLPFLMEGLQLIESLQYVGILG